jgi:hypothetical protein
MTYFFMLYVVSLAFGYVTRFTEATLQLGRTLSKVKEGNIGFRLARGFQDAITPPIFTKFAIAVYVFTGLVLGFGFYHFGILIELLSVALFFLFVLLNQPFMPKPDSSHFRNLILRSMINRHANYMKDRDYMRADVMAEILESAGMPVKDFVREVRNRHGS